MSAKQFDTCNWYGPVSYLIAIANKLTAVESDGCLDNLVRNWQAKVGHFCVNITRRHILLYLTALCYQRVRAIKRARACFRLALNFYFSQCKRYSIASLFEYSEHVLIHFPALEHGKNDKKIKVFTWGCCFCTKRLVTGKLLWSGKQKNLTRCKNPLSQCWVLFLFIFTHLE